VAVAPKEPNVEITANPIGPQLHAPDIIPMKEPVTPPEIFCFAIEWTLIRYTFIGITIDAKPDKIRIKMNPNS